VHQVQPSNIHQSIRDQLRERRHVIRQADIATRAEQDNLDPVSRILVSWLGRQATGIARTVRIDASTGATVPPAAMIVEDRPA